MNYDNHLFRVSSLPNIMSKLTLGLDVYESANAKKLEIFGKYQKYQDEYDAIKNKATKTAENKAKQIENYNIKYHTQKALADMLEERKDDVIISDWCKTHLVDVHISTKYGRSTKDIKSKYIEKGLMMEGTGIAIYSVVKGKVFEKNERRLDDGYIMGEIDFEDEEIVCDNKCSWDIWTFFRNLKYLEKPDQNPYFANMQGYMKLWERESSRVVYTLTDTPEKLIENEIKKLQYDFIGSKDMLDEAVEELKKNMTYSDIPLSERVIEIEIKRDDEFISNIQKAVIACRQYLNTLN